MPGEERTGPNDAVIRTRLQPFSNAMWYRNPHPSNLVIRYGTYGEMEFRGHQLILCSASKRFMNASQDWKEYREQTIVLSSDSPDSLGVLFEHAYTQQYKKQQKEEAFRAAAGSLEAYAFRNLEDVVDDFTLMHRHIGETGEFVAPVFYRWMDKEIYYYADDYFPALYEACPPSAVDEKAEGAAGSPSSVRNPVQISSSPDVEEEEEEEKKKKVGILDPSHPVDRTKSLLIQAAVRVWAGDESPLERQDLITIAGEILEVDRDLSVAALQSLSLLPVREDEIEVEG
ncbi:BTB domain containing protein [Pyrenophora tritici-repentis]|nr:BTB domain containing protein [Pyrenophora tritici-repentis]KAI1673752.1 BTB domain containing protein [Pyrenophora tritici-repentis]KAI1689167.1 BTB domain containing protein [Pyrenophora tritici-repentis]